MSDDAAAWADAGLAFRVEECVAWLVLDRPQVRKRHPVPAARRPARRHRGGPRRPRRPGRRGHRLGDGVLRRRRPHVAAAHRAPARAAARRPGQHRPRGRAAVRLVAAGPGHLGQREAVRRRGERVARGETVLPPGFEHWGFAGWVRHPIGKPPSPAVNGAAMGGGAELLLSCGLAVAVEHAVIGLPEVTIGMIAADGGPFRALAQLPQRIGMELVLTGEPITAARAPELHLVNRVVPGGQLLDAAMELAGRIAADAPLAIQASARIAFGLRDAERPADRLHRELTRESAHATAASADAKEGVSAVLEKRPPVWTGR